MLFQECSSDQPGFCVPLNFTVILLTKEAAYLPLGTAQPQPRKPVVGVLRSRRGWASRVVLICRARVAHRLVVVGVELLVNSVLFLLFCGIAVVGESFWGKETAAIVVSQFRLTNGNRRDNEHTLPLKPATSIFFVFKNRYEVERFSKTLHKYQLYTMYLG